MLLSRKQETAGFQELLETAKLKINEYYPAWSNFNPADSGMAILELFAYMTELQQFHAEQLGESHKMAFLHLLGMKPENLQPAKLYAEARGMGKSRYLPAGTKIEAGGMVWESELPVYLDSGLKLAETEKMPLYPFGESPAEDVVCELCLTGNLKEAYTYMMYFDVADEYSLKRNPIVQEDFLPLVNFSLEYFDGTDYQPCQLLLDETFGLLQSGFVQFRTGGVMKKKEGKYLLRLHAKGEYDTAPLLKQISFHMVPLIQRDTRVESREYLLSPWGDKFYWLAVDSWNAVHGNNFVYRMEHGKAHRLRRFMTDISNGLRYFVFAAEELGAGEEAPSVRLVSVQEGYSPEQFSFEADGTPNQCFYLPDKNILGSEFTLWIEEEEGRYVSWKQVADLAAGEGERCYVLEEETGLLRFGDGKNGLRPAGRIEITGYALCTGRLGNIQKKQKLHYVHEMGQEYFYNPLPGTGGKDPETVENCISRYLDAWKEPKRAVTIEDYEYLIGRTPGLRIKKVKVFQGVGGDNCFEAAIQPYTNGGRILKKNFYQRNIMAFMEKKKLLGTGLIIRKTEYIGLTLQLEVMVKNRFLEAETTVKESVQEYFDTHMDFGETMVYSRLYAYIDSMPETAGIRELSIYTGERGVIREDNGDIRFPPNGIAYLEHAEIRCIRKN